MKTRHMFTLLRMWLLAGMVSAAGLFAAPMHLGSRDIYAGGKTHVEAPILLTNFDQQVVKRVDFTLRYPTAALGSPALPAASIMEGWTANIVSSGAGWVRISAENGGEGTEVSWLHLLNLRFPTTGTSTQSLEFEEIRINGIILAGLETTPFRIRNTSLPAKGDINGDGRIDIADVDAALEALTAGTANSTFPDFNQSGSFDAHDAGLLHRHVVGLLPGLLSAAAGNTYPPALVPKLTMQAPKALGNNIYSYVVRGENLRGIISADLVFQIDGNIIANINSTRFAQTSVISKEATLGGRRHIRFSTPHAVDSSPLDWLEIIAVHKPGQTGQGISIPNYYEVKTQSASSPAMNAVGITYGLQIFNNPPTTRVHNPNAPHVPFTNLTLDNYLCESYRWGEAYPYLIYSMQGRLLRRGFLTSGTPAVLPVLPPGKYQLRLNGPEVLNFSLDVQK